MLLNCGVGAEKTVADKAQRVMATKLVERILASIKCVKRLARRWREAKKTMCWSGTFGLVWSTGNVQSSVIYSTHLHKILVNVPRSRIYLIVTLSQQKHGTSLIHHIAYPIDILERTVLARFEDRGNYAWCGCCRSYGGAFKLEQYTSSITIGITAVMDAVPNQHAPRWR
jgi:hypothetical protein